MAVLAALSVMAGLDPATHANAAIEEEHGRSASSGTIRVRVDARHKGGHDGWVGARRPSPSWPGHDGWVGAAARSVMAVLAALSVMAGLDPATHANAAIEEEHGPFRTSSGTTRVRVDARLEGGHDGWVRARRPSPSWPGHDGWVGARRP